MKFRFLLLTLALLCYSKANTMRSFLNENVVKESNLSLVSDTISDEPEAFLYAHKMTANPEDDILVYGQSIDGRNLHVNFQRLRNALVKSGYIWANDCIDSQKLRFAYASIAYNARYPKRTLANVFKGPAVTKRIDGVIYILLNPEKFEELDRYDRDLIVAHEIGHSMSTCERKCEGEEYLADHIAGIVFAFISAYQNDKGADANRRLLAKRFKQALSIGVIHFEANPMIKERTDYLLKGYDHGVATQ